MFGRLVRHGLLAVCVVSACQSAPPEQPQELIREQQSAPELSVLPPISEPNAEQIARANLDLGVAYLRRGELEKALNRLDKSRAQDANNALLYNVYALVYQALDDVPRAEKNFRRALRMARNNSRIRNNYGQFLCEQKRWAEAKKLLSSVLDDALYESPEIAHVNLAACARSQGDHAVAYQHYEAALSHAPNLAPVMLSLGELDLQQGDYQRARQRLHDYLQLAAHTARSAWLGVRIERVLGNQDALASYVLLLRNKFPDSPQAQRYRQGEARDP